MYTAAVLTNLSKDLLRWIAINKLSQNDRRWQFSTPSGDELPHHMTINLGNFNTNLNDQSILGKFVDLKINCISYNEELGACAFPVIVAKAEISDAQWVKIKTINEHPHITACLMPGINPKTSNEVLQSNDTVHLELDRAYHLEAWVEEVKPQKTYMK